MKYSWGRSRFDQRQDRGSRSKSAIGLAISEALEGRRLLSGVSFPSGFTAANTLGVLSINSPAVISGTSLELTDGGGGEDGTAFSTGKVSTEGFTTTFSFALTGSGTLADGFCFVLQNNSPTENLGAAAAGGSLGYNGMPASIAVKFDLYQNVTEGNDSTGLFVNGDEPTVPSGSNPSEASKDMTSSGVKLTSGDAMSATLTYNGTTLSESVTDTKLNKTFSTTYTINIPATIGSGTAYVGFTAGTGGSAATQKINTWTYTETLSAPYAPTSIAATAPTSTELDLSWAEPYSQASSYNIYRQNSGGSFVSIGSSGTTTFHNTGLTPSTTYTYEIQAVNSAGTATSAPFSATTPLIPTVISHLTASAITTSSATLTWTNGSGITSITITRTLVPDNTVVTTTLPATAVSFADSGMLPGREYDYAVSGTTSAGATQPTALAVQTVPGQPQSVDGNVNGTTVSLNWDPLGFAVAGYNIYRGTSPGGESTTPIATNVSGSSYNDPNLTPGVTYYYVVTAVDSGGEGVPSGEVSALADVASPDLVISEFLASNATSITDAAGEHSDWIEIHNAGSGDADLSDYYLTDDATEPELWQFPKQTLAAGGYLIVFADGENISIAGQELHTNFGLSKAGGYLGLIGANDIPQYQYSPGYPVQDTDISYGMADSDNPNSALESFGTPTPGTPNAPTATAAVFSQTGKTFSGSLSVLLSSTTPGAQIRYTLDNSAPTNTSTLYTGAITVGKTEMIRARVFAAGYTSSVIDSQTYIAIASTETSFNNNLGIVVIDTFGKALNDTTDILAGATFIPASNGTANILGSASNYDGRIGLHVRGNSSEGFPKQQWGITLWDENNNNTDAALMGMPSDDKWILNDPYSEKSLLQNPLAYEWANDTGVYASRTQFVEVFLNTTGATSIGTAQYWGVYILEERIKIDNNRVDINKMSPTDVTAPADTGGYIWEKDRPDSTDTTFTTTTENETYIMIDPNSSEINSTQLAYISGYVDQFEAALYGSNFENPTTGYAAYINVSSFVNTWLIEEMVKNVDGFRLSSYYYKDKNGLINAGPIWDNNLSLGNANYSPENLSNPLDFGSNPDGYDSSQLTNADLPYYNRLFQDPAFKQAVVDRWSELRSTVFTNANLVGNINALVNELSNNTTNYPVGANGAVPTQPATNAVVRNFQRWNVLGVYEWPNGWYDPAGRWIQEVNMTENWVLARVAWMDSQLLPAPQLTPGGVESTVLPVTISPYSNVAADTVLVASGGPIKAIVPTAAISNWNGLTFNDSAWSSGSSGVGYDNNSSGFTPYIGLSTSSMYNVNQTVYTRSYFTLTDPTTVQSLILELRYSSGLVAYLNGVQIAYENAPVSNDLSTATWNTGASALQSNSAAIAYAQFDVSVFKNALVAGTNVLAIQGLNDGKANGSFLLEPMLVSRVTTPLVTTVGAIPVYYTTNGTDPRNSDGSISASAILYAGSWNVSANTTVEARTYINGTWSGLATSVYQFARPTIAITELNYDPAKVTGANPNAYNNDDFEFIEFENYGTSPVNFNGFTFTSGIDYTFGSVILNPGQVGVLVKNLPAFQFRYGTSFNVLGNYLASNDSFSNSGELVTLNDSLGNNLASFTYSTAWSTGAHGGGFTLEVTNPASLPDLNLAGSWQTSTATNGTPGTIELNLSGPSYLRVDAANPYVDVWNTATPTGAAAQVIQLTSLNAMNYTGITAGTGLTVDFSNGNPLIASGLSFNGGVGNLSSLAIVGTTGNDTLTVNAATLAFNSALTGGAVINYVNAASVLFNGGTGADVLTQAAQPGEGATLVFANPTSSDTLNVAAGSYNIAAPTTGAGIVKTTLGTINIAAGASLVLGTAPSHSDRILLVDSNLSIAGATGDWTGELDLGGNDLELLNANPGTVFNQLAQGFGGSTNGIISSAARADSSHLTTLGILKNQDGSGNPLYGSSAPLGLFDGLTNPGSNEVLVKYTYLGDANLDGKVDSTDYALTDNGFLTQSTGWYNGDLNFDGVINGSDYTLLDNAFNMQGAGLAASIATPTAQLAARSTATSQLFQTSKPITLAVANDNNLELLLNKKDLLDLLSARISS